jgi:hypothetical protein
MAYRVAADRRVFTPYERMPVQSREKVAAAVAWPEEDEYHAPIEFSRLLISADAFSARIYAKHRPSARVHNFDAAHSMIYAARERAGAFSARYARRFHALPPSFPPEQEFAT